jgi:hypothetical protein
MGTQFSSTSDVYRLKNVHDLPIPMAVSLLGFWFRILPTAWMFIRCECCVLWSRDLCNELITRPEDPYRVQCMVVCDLETSRMRKPWPPLWAAAPWGVGWGECCRTRTVTKSVNATCLILIMKANEMHYFSDLFDKVHYMFRTGPLPIIRSISLLYTRNRYLSCYLSWLCAGVVWMELQFHPDHASRQSDELAWQILIACTQCWDARDDGQWTCPKHVEYFIK